MKNKALRVVILILFVVLFFLFLNPNLFKNLISANFYNSWANLVHSSFSVDSIKLTPLSILGFTITLLATYAINRIFSIILEYIKHNNPHKNTMSKVLSGCVRIVIWLFGVIFALNCIGVDFSSIILSIGVVGVVVGLGAQSLIEDILTGFFVIIDNQYNVGDIVNIDGFRGKITNVSLRTVSLIDNAGNTRSIKHSEIESVINLSTADSTVVVEIPINYRDSIEKINKAIEKAIDHAESRCKELMLARPINRGVNGFEGDFYKMLITCVVKEENIYSVKRILQDEIVKQFQKEGFRPPKDGNSEDDDD